jgi:hypothetical protein
MGRWYQSRGSHVSPVGRGDEDGGVHGAGRGGAAGTSGQAGGGAGAAAALGSPGGLIPMAVSVDSLMGIPKGSEL